LLIHLSNKVSIHPSTTTPPRVNLPLLKLSNKQNKASKIARVNQLFK
jgi:hypothetical protein